MHFFLYQNGNEPQHSGRHSPVHPIALHPGISIFLVFPQKKLQELTVFTACIQDLWLVLVLRPRGKNSEFGKSDFFHSSISPAAKGFPRPLPYFDGPKGGSHCMHVFLQKPHCFCTAGPQNCANGDSAPPRFCIQWHLHFFFFLLSTIPTPNSMLLMKTNIFSHYSHYFWVERFRWRALWQKWGRFEVFQSWKWPTPSPQMKIQWPVFGITVKKWWLPRERSLMWAGFFTFLSLNCNSNGFGGRAAEGREV